MSPRQWVAAARKRKVSRMMNWWEALSMVGSTAVTGPLSIAIAAWLLAGRSWRLSLSWCLLFGGGMLLVVLTKMAYIGWGIGIEEVQFGGLSGHAMRACAVFPVALYLAFHHTRPSLRQGATVAGIVLGVLISMSRVPVLAHSVSEVLLGGAVGLAVAAAFIVHAASERPGVAGRVLLALCLPVLCLAPLAKPVPAERWITQLALRVSGNTAPVGQHWILGTPEERAEQRLRRLQELRERQQNRRQQQLSPVRAAL